MTKIDKGRITGICKDIKKEKTLETLRSFLKNEINFINEAIHEEHSKY